MLPLFCIGLAGPQGPQGVAGATVAAGTGPTSIKPYASGTPVVMTTVLNNLTGMVSLAGGRGYDEI